MTVHNGFQVQHDALDGAAHTLPTQVNALGDTHQFLLSRQVPASAFANVDASARVGATHNRTIDDNARQLAEARQRLEKIITEVRATNVTVRQWDDAEAAKQKAQGPEPRLAQAQTDSPAPAPATIPERDAANRTRIQSALDAERTNLTNLRAAQAEYERGGLPSWLGGPSDRTEDIGRSAARIANYESILAGDTRILHFDPAGNGRIVGLIGDLDGNTQSVGVLVPGTGTGMHDFTDYESITRSFADPGRPGGGISTIVWMDGDFPQSLGLGGAASPADAQEMAPRLRDFINDEVRPQLGDHTRVTVIGHSYGGAVVGMADAAGMRADNVVHVASAGMGNGIMGPDNLNNPHPVTRYAITSAYDPIQWVQGAGPHGADPDTFPGVIPLPAGRDAAGNVLSGVPAHIGMFQPYSDSWMNINGVITGGAVPALPVRPAR